MYTVHPGLNMREYESTYHSAACLSILPDWNVYRDETIKLYSQRTTADVHAAIMACLAVAQDMYRVRYYP